MISSDEFRFLKSLCDFELTGVVLRIRIVILSGEIRFVVVCGVPVLYNFLRRHFLFCAEDGHGLFFSLSPPAGEL